MNFTRRCLLPVILLSLVPAYRLPGQTPESKGLEAITLNSIQAQLDFLASDLMEGREAGSRGEYLAGEYIASMLQLYGIKPCGDESTYFQNFMLQKTNEEEAPVLEIRSLSPGTSKSVSLEKNVDFQYRTFTRNIEIEAPVAYVPGIMSGNNNIEESSVRGKFIIMSSAKKLSRTEYAEIEKTLRSKGAAGIIEIVPGSSAKVSPGRNYLAPLSKEKTPGSPVSAESYFLPGSNSDDFVRLSVSMDGAKKIFNGTGIDPGKDTSGTFPVSSPGDRKIYFRTSVRTTLVPVRNILGIIEGNKADEIIVIGAHYDHMGMHDGYIWNGADDNGSGTTAVLSLARAMAETGKKPEKTIVFAFWTAEEKGLLGSRYYVQNSVSAGKIKLNVNFDMISRYVSDNEPDKVTMTYTSAYSFFRNMTKDNLKKYGINLDVDYQPSPDPPGGSDHRSFVAAGIPVMRFKAGHREEYHTPLDEVSTIDWDIMEKIIKISFLNVWQLANSAW